MRSGQHTFLNSMNDLLETVSAWPRYLISVIFGVFYNAAMWLKPLTQKPVTLVALIGLTVSGFLFITFTLRAMLGLSPVN